MGDIIKGTTIVSGQMCTAAQMNKLVDDAVLKPGCITEDKIAAGAVTLEKLSFSAIAKEFLKNIFQVGDYFYTQNDTNPAERFGGTWELVKDKFLLGAGGEYELLSEGGEKEHTLSKEEMPEHTHTMEFGVNGQTSGGGCVTYGLGIIKESSAAGGGKPHNNMPPYKAVYIWLKTAD